jgi:uncharacterized protein (UPF0332 family)
MSLDLWFSHGWLIRHRSSAQELDNLFAVAARDMRDADLNGLSTDSRLSLAYNAALQVAAAALYAEGYRPAKGQGIHVRTIQSLAYTLGADAATVQQFERFADKRHRGHYDRAGVATDTEADAMVALAKDLIEKVEKWLAANHPDLWKRTKP